MQLSNFLQLVRNENMKLYAKKGTWAMVIILTLLVLAGGFIAKFMDDTTTKEYGDNWREEMQQEIAEAEQNPDSYINVDKNTYYLENDIEPQSYGAMQFAYENTGMASIITLLTIIVAGGILATEFNQGTIKLLLIRPVSRLKILASKYVTVLLFALTLLVILFVWSWIVGAILFGVNGMNPSAVIYQMAGYTQVNLLSEIGIEFGLSLVNLIMMATFAFMISTIFRNSSMAIGFAIFLMFAGNLVINFVGQYDWAKYILFVNTDLSQYREGFGGPLLEGMSLSFSITVLLVYYIIFIVASWLSFIKRDVAGQ